MARRTRISGDEELIDLLGSMGNVATATDDYTAALDDAGGLVIVTKASGVNFTVPPEATVAWPAGSVLTVAQGGAGAVTVVAGSGVTINKKGGQTLITGGQHETIRLIKTGTNTWVVDGVHMAAARADLTAITGGESPTEAEHNAIITAFNDLLAKLRDAGVLDDA